MVTSIPTATDCLRILKNEGVPPHIQRHSIMVAKVGALIAGSLNAEMGKHVAGNVVVAACLLHDIKKMECIERGCDHAHEGYRFLNAMGLNGIAHIVRQHYRLDEENKDFSKITPVHICYYADNRVKHHEVVSVEERFKDLITRYGKDEATKASLRKRLKETLYLEKEIFSYLEFNPHDVVHLVKRVKF